LKDGKMEIKEINLKVLQKVVSVLERMPDDIFKKWFKNGSQKDYQRLREFMENNLPIPKLGNPDDTMKPEDEFPVGC